ncbi:MAG: hypothetical protein ABH851_06535, partial [Methanobacteriota archaeon]
MNGYSWFWWIREKFEQCDLLSSATEREICKASAMAYASQVGFTENVLLYQALREPTVVQAETGTLPLIVALGIVA